MRKGAMLLLALAVLTCVVAGSAGAWQRSRMFDCQTPMGPEWAHHGRPAWQAEVNKSGGYWNGVEDRTSEYGGREEDLQLGIPADKRLSYRIAYGYSTSDQKLNLKYINHSTDIDPSKTLKVVWYLCMTPRVAGHVGSHKTPIVDIATGYIAGVHDGYRVKAQFNVDPAKGPNGWYPGNTQSAAGGNGTTIDGKAAYGMATGIWHRLTLELKPTGEYTITINSDTANAITGLASQSGATSNRINWGQTEGINNRDGADIFTEYFYWGQLDGGGSGDATDEVGSPLVDGQSTLVTDDVPVVSGTSTTITWGTTRVSNSSVTWGYEFANSSVLTTTVGTGPDSTSHSVTLTGLEPNREYTFWCESTDAGDVVSASAMRRFRTAKQDVTPQLLDGGFESGCDNYCWQDVFNTDPTKQLRVYKVLDLGYQGQVNPFSGEGFLGTKLQSTVDRRYASYRQEVATTSGKWYQLGFKFWGFSNGGPNTGVMGRGLLDPAGGEEPGTIVGDFFTPNPGVSVGAWATGTLGVPNWVDGYAFCKATGSSMSVYIQPYYNSPEYSTFIGFDAVSFAEMVTPPPATCGGAKAVPFLGYPVDLQGVVVTYKDLFNPIAYVENDDRSSGIRVTGNALDPYGLGSAVNVSGFVRQDASGELYVDATAVSPASANAVYAVGVVNKAVGGGAFGLQPGVNLGPGLDAAGQNNVGLLVRTWGKLTAINGEIGDTAPCSIYLDDGSGVEGTVTGSMATETGVEVLISDLVNENLNPGSFTPGSSYVMVTGVVSMKNWYNVKKPVILIRQYTDISVSAL